MNLRRVGTQIGVQRAAARACGLAIGERPAKLAERGIGRFLAIAENVLEGESAGGGGKEKMLHCIVLVIYVANMILDNIIVKG